MMQQWVRVRKWILPALVDTTEPEIIQDLLNNRATLWPGEKCAFITQLTHNEHGKFLHVHLGGGDGREMLAMIAGMAAWGRAQGCQYASVNGRKGWKRKLREHGFEPRDGELWKAL